MELDSRHVFFGLVAALALGGGYAWYIARPAEDARAASIDTAPAPESVQAGPAPTLYKWKDDKGVVNLPDKAPNDREYTASSGTQKLNSVPTVVPETDVEAAAGEE